MRRKEQDEAVCGRDNSGNGVDSQQRQWQGQATVVEAEAVQGQTTINQKGGGATTKTRQVDALTEKAFGGPAALVRKGVSP